VRRVKVGSIAVDSGQVMIVDPCYVESGWKRDESRGPPEPDRGITYKAVCAAKKPSYGGVPYRALDGKRAFGAVVATSGQGDGIYPVYADIDKNGAVRSLTILFEPK